MPVPHFTEATLASYAAPQIIERGRAYYKQGRVSSLVWRGSILFAEVEGSEGEAYLVRCTCQEQDLLTATCTCPYDWGGWCKHIVATCLALLLQPETIQQRPPLEHLLTDLTHEQLQTLLLTLAERDPSLVITIERTLNLLYPPVPVTTPPQQARHDPSTSVISNPGALRQRVQRAVHSLDRMRSSEAYWHVETAVNDVRRLLDQVWPLIHADQGEQALPALEAITETYLEEWETLDDSAGEASSLFFDLGNAWAEAVLSSTLISKQRQVWVARLTGWQNRLIGYGVDDALECAVAAAQQGWDYAPLRQVLQGKITRQGAWRGEPPSYADDLTCIRLSILERRGLVQEYLFLAQAEGQDVAYATMLIRLNRVQEAVDYGLQALCTQRDALALATVLCEQGEHEQSLRIARHGLTFEGGGSGLAPWLREQAIALNQRELALLAAEHAFRAEVTLENYLRIAELAAEQWTQRRPELLAEAQQADHRFTRGWVAILLHEKLLDEAIAMLTSYPGQDLIATVADTVFTERPEWVLQASCRQAELLMGSGHAHNYQPAIDWLKRARTAYRFLQREAEWDSYLETLLHAHRRKSRLLPLLEALRT
jgi:uncharacterized Zn finger protein